MSRQISCQEFDGLRNAQGWRPAGGNGGDPYATESILIYSTADGDSIVARTCWPMDQSGNVDLSCCTHYLLDEEADDE